MAKECGNPKCGVSTGIHEGLTFGSGELDMGYWEHPCFICARAWEKAHPEDAPCWPYAEPSRDEMLIAEANMILDAKQGIKRVLRLLKNAVDTMRDRKAKEDGSEPYRKERWAQYDEAFVVREVADPLACILAELEKVKTPEE